MDRENRCLNCMETIDESGKCNNCGWEIGSEPESSLHLKQGTILNGKYLIGRVLGQGGFGITYLAYDLMLDIKLAIKEFFPQGLASRAIGISVLSVFSGDKKDQYEYGLDKFFEEAKKLARFNEVEGVVTVRDIFRENQTAYVVMEYIEGITLKEYVEKSGGKLPIDMAMNIMLPVMEALEKVHQKGILHRDISPDNIYITKDLKVKLLDFGAARYAVGEQSRSLSVILKPGYAPEEQYRTRGKQGPWTDVYAVAATLYHVITGVVPPESLDRMEEDTLVLPSQMGFDLPKHIEKALVKALEVRGVNRFENINAFKDSLENDQESVCIRNQQKNINNEIMLSHISDKPNNEVEGKEEVKHKKFYKKNHLKKRKKLRLTFIFTVALILILILYTANVFEIRSSSRYIIPAMLGNADAQFNLGCCYPKYEQAVPWYTKAAEKGHADAQSKLGYCYFKGLGVKEDLKQSVYWYTKAADQGHILSQSNLGDFYHNGTGVEQDYKQAAYWYEKAAVQGSKFAQNNLGSCYYHGLGVERDYEQAVYWYTEAAEQGNTDAEFYLGNCYHNGEGVEKDYEQALYWYTKAAEEGHVDAQNNLGYCYYVGIGVKQDYNQALFWFTKAAENGHTYAQYNLAICYDNGEGVEQDFEQAAHWYTKVAEKGHSGAQNNLGVCYFNGEGVEQDFEQAIYWYTKAAKNGHTYAQNNLGACYFNGDGVEQNFEQAVYWCTKAAEEDYADAHYNLGVCYFNGDGVEQDFERAVYWYTKAAENGHIRAQYNLASCYATGQGVELSYRLAVYWADIAVKGYADAKYYLGIYYEYGLGGEKDEEQALYWYPKAANH